jgi:hypothetical protein
MKEMLSQMQEKLCELEALLDKTIASSDDGINQNENSVVLCIHPKRSTVLLSRDGIDEDGITFFQALRMIGKWYEKHGHLDMSDKINAAVAAARKVDI